MAYSMERNTTSAESASTWTPWIDRTAVAAACIENLPAVACADWCDQAASKLGVLPGVLAALVMLVRCEGASHRVELDAVGLSAQPSLPEQPSLSDAQQLNARSRLESLASSGRLTLDASVLGSREIWGDAPELVPHQAWSRFGGGDRILIAQLVTSPAQGGSVAPLIAVLDALTPQLARRATIALGSGGGAPTWLTGRENLVLDHLILGSSVREIAHQIGRSPHTVHDHVKNLHRKLGASSRGALIARALGQGASASLESLRPVAARTPSASPGRASADREFEPKSGSSRALSGPA